MTHNELVERIRLGEDSTLQLKCLTFRGDKIIGPEPRFLADEIAAMANGHGGTILLGVDSKSRKIPGIPIDLIDDTEMWVSTICNDRVVPPVDAKICNLAIAEINEQSVQII